MGTPYKLTYDQVAGLLQMLRDGALGVEAARAYGITPAAITYWKRYTRMDADWLRHVRETEHLALFQAKELIRRQQQLRIAQDALGALLPSKHRRAAWAGRLRVTHGASHTTANEVFGLTPSAGLRAPSRDLEAGIVDQMRTYLSKHRSHGFRRMVARLFPCPPCAINQLKHLYREAGLQLVAKQKRSLSRLPDAPRRPKTLPSGRDVVWSIDWMLVSVAARRFWVLNVIDDYSRECILSAVYKRVSALNVIDALESVTRGHRKPQSIRSDNGGCFRSDAYTRWAWRRGIALQYSRPGKPQDNVFVERLHWTVRREVEEVATYRSAQGLQRALDTWRQEYNITRPHRSLGGLSPLQYAALHG